MGTACFIMGFCIGVVATIVAACLYVGDCYYDDYLR